MPKTYVEVLKKLQANKDMFIIQVNNRGRVIILDSTPYKSKILNLPVNKKLIKK